MNKIGFSGIQGTVIMNREFKGLTFDFVKHEEGSKVKVVETQHGFSLFGINPLNISNFRFGDMHFEDEQRRISREHNTQSDKFISAKIAELKDGKKLGLMIDTRDGAGLPIESVIISADNKSEITAENLSRPSLFIHTLDDAVLNLKNSTANVINAVNGTLVKVLDNAEARIISIKDSVLEHNKSEIDVESFINSKLRKGNVESEPFTQDNLQINDNK